ncbi:MAG: PPOX class F420-dependent oxidoreductase, partial [Frankia sp.]|nr:PPOX class F420-dependent oxidoreductase [Frankia sp.]
LVSTDPWIPRYLRIYGDADVVERPSRSWSPHYVRISPTISWSFNLDGKPFDHNTEIKVRRTVHTRPQSS